MKLRCLGIALFVSVASCEKAAPDFGKQVTYAFVSDYALQRNGNIAGTDSCFHAVQLKGQLTFLVNQATWSFVDAEGRLQVAQLPDAALGSCDSIPLTFESPVLTANATGTMNIATFVVETTGTAPGGITYTRRYTYKGTLHEDGGTGVLTYELKGTSGTRLMTNTMVVGVTLIPVTDAAKADPPGKG